MIVYVESNFILELTYGQEQSGSAAQILEFAKDRKIKLVVPTYSLAESRQAIARRTEENRNALMELERFRRLLGRTTERQHLADALGPILESARSLDRETSERYRGVLGKLRKHVSRIELSEQIMMNSIELEADAGLKGPDAIILASILADLSKRRGRELKLFVSKDRKDFGSQEVRMKLKQLDCHFLPDFGNAVQRIRSESKKPSIHAGKERAR